jgi:hypothetical protein
MAEDGNVPNEIKVVENRSAVCRVTTVNQQPFHVTLCMTSSLKENDIFDKTVVSSFMKLISCN